MDMVASIPQLNGNGKESYTGASSSALKLEVPEDANIPWPGFSHMATLGCKGG